MKGFEQLRHLIRERASHLCEYCLIPRDYCNAPYEVEHIIPKCKEGPTEESNLALSCGGCNGHKATATMSEDPVTGEIVPLFNPRADAWESHFSWDEAQIQMIGISATGRATIERLKLNRQEVRNLRKLLKQIDKHPPNG